MSSDVEAQPATGRPVPLSRRHPWRLAAAFLAGIALAAALIAGWPSGGGAGRPADATLGRSEQAAIDTAVTKALDAANGLQVSEIFARIQPSLVVIEVDEAGAPGATAASIPGDALGTGIVVNQDGSVLTADHVVADASAIRVVFADGTTSAAAVIAADAERDIAVLRADTPPSVVVPAVLGGGAAIGDPVVAVGNPLGLVASTSAGVVSGLDRDVTGEDGRQHTGLIQFDAAVNPGSSGGPLLNARAEVVGVVVALANPTSERYFIGIGFAVPIATALAGGGAAPPK